MDPVNAAVIAAESGEYPQVQHDAAAWLDRAYELVARFIDQPFDDRYEGVTE
jgi:beta-lactamase class A